MIAEQQPCVNAHRPLLSHFPFFTIRLSFRMNKNVSRSHNFVLRRN